MLRQEFPALKSRLPTLWTNSYFVATVLSVIIRLAHYLRHGNPSPDHFAVHCPCGKRWRR